MYWRAITYTIFPRHPDVVPLAFVFVLSLLVKPCHAQRSSMIYGDIPRSDLQMSTYENDTSAVHVVLNEYVAANSISASIVPDAHARIKALKKEGVNFVSNFIRIYSPVDGSAAAVETLPATKILVLPAGNAKYIHNITQQGNMLSVVSILQVNKAMFLQTEYSHLREFYAQVISKQAEQLVFKQIN